MEPLFDPSVKKKKKSKKVAGEAQLDAMVGEVDAMDVSAPAAEPSPAADAPGGDIAFEFKKKKKKKAPVADDFELALQEAGVEEKEQKTELQTMQNVESTGQDAGFEALLHRFFEILREKNPEMASSRGGSKTKIPEPKVERDGNKKTLFSNIMLIAEAIHRPGEHVIHFMFAELGTSGSVDGEKRLVIKGRFQPKQIEGVLRRYIKEYVSCKTCKSVNTRLTKENRLHFLDCNACGSRRSVQNIKTGYQAVTRRSRMRKE